LTKFIREESAVRPAGSPHTRFGGVRHYGWAEG
jgi:hypothetical protein